MMKEGAMVVMHDTAFHLLGNHNMAYATKILLDSVSGVKYYDYSSDTINIGAFVITDETKRNIANVFSSLSITWTYEPSFANILLYRDWYKKYYDEECITLFDCFWERNHNRILKDKFST